MATVVFGDFEWDDRKAAANLRIHRVSFEEAITALADPHAIEAPDLADPRRWITVGIPRCSAFFSSFIPKHFPVGERASSARAKRQRDKGGSMKEGDPAKLPEGHLARYDWARARRGRLAGKAAKASRLLRILEPDLATHFPDSRAVNEALRALLALDAALSRRRPSRGRAA